MIVVLFVFTAALLGLIARFCVYFAAKKGYNRWDAHVSGLLFSVAAFIRYLCLPSRPWPSGENSTEPMLAIVETLCPICSKPIPVGAMVKSEPSGRLLHVDCAEVFLPMTKQSARPKDPVPSEDWGTARFCRTLIIYVAVHAWLLAGFLASQPSQIMDFQRSHYPRFEQPDMSLEAAVAIGTGSIIGALSISICLAGFWLANAWGHINRAWLCKLLFPFAVMGSVVLIDLILVSLLMRIFSS